MQAIYQNKHSTVHWDTLNIEYPVNQFYSTGASSESIARQRRGQPEVIKESRRPNIEELEYERNYNVTKELTQSQTATDQGYKPTERFRFNKHTPCNQNEYIYPPCRKLADRVPSSTTYPTSEMRSSYETPTFSSRLVTDKDQYKHPASLPLNLPEVTRNNKEFEPLDTTYEGYEKYLDPYLTTSRLHHRPYTAHELTKQSNSKDIMTYYIYTDMPWVRVPRPKTNQWGLSISNRPKSMFDREKFKEDCREIRTHNKLRWVPGTFRTEIRDNFVAHTSPEAHIHNYEEEVRTHYQRTIGQLSANISQDDPTRLRSYSTENSTVGSRKPTCVIFDPYVAKNKRLALKCLRPTCPLP